MGKTAFLFPGQGAQHVGMGASIIESNPAAKQLFDKASEILDYDLAALCKNGPAEKLDSTAVSQPAIFVTSLAALEMLKQDSPEVVADCDMAAGLSLGEYTALTFAGAMTFEEGLKVVKRRGEAMQAAADATPSGMVSLLLLSIEQVEEVVQKASAEGEIRIANYLCPGNTVVSGVISACEKAAELGEEAGGRAIPLAVAGAFHSPIMKPADEQLAEALADVEILTPKIPVISNVDATTHEDPAELRDILVKQVLNPVRWEETMRLLLEKGYSEFYEIGPGKVLKGLLKRVNRKANCTTVNDS